MHVYVCMYVCVCVCVYVCMCVYRYIYIYIYVYTCMYVYACMHNLFIVLISRGGGETLQAGTVPLGHVPLRLLTTTT